jgi:aminomethyltransferase
MLDQPEVEPIGLGARDSLRLEAGLCLYGNEMDDNTSPLEAGLLWTIGKRRRAEGGFCGADKILAEIADRKLVKRKLVGLNLTGKGPPPRSHDALLNEHGETIGEVTSGVFGPTAGQPVAMGYLEKAVRFVRERGKVLFKNDLFFFRLQFFSHSRMIFPSFFYVHFRPT